MKDSSDLKKKAYQKNQFFSKKQLSLKTRASEKVPYHEGRKKSLSFLHDLIHKAVVPDLLNKIVVH